MRKLPQHQVDPGEETTLTEFVIKDSGKRQEFAGGMQRDTEEGKIDFTSCLHGPMFKRWNDHMTKGRAKYPDPVVGIPNWTLGAGDPEVLERARRSAFRHFISWLNGETDEDHAAGVFFNINVAEYVKESLSKEPQRADDPEPECPCWSCDCPVENERCTRCVC